ncbi:hypothetical protein BJ508DRAFT_244000 [Ascobolus immersus RN42]|uniref:RING-type domain-containing protein n=1 Tax=Ascobolus immersus RN42 TaxID=1160509 RepID=A0A3N4HR17_ASCIM|nr:hypothetical protein BJ508DRAFT_244000 [Ascobolus immersus RN42]
MSNMPPPQDKIAPEDDNDTCPVCKSTRYLNPTLSFLINNCYHRLCSSCVSRRFTLGPAPCPYPNCTLILRKNKFRRQTFASLETEREVDVRRRVARVFNKRTENFVLGMEGEERDEAMRRRRDYEERIEKVVFALLKGGEEAQWAERELEEEARDESGIRENEERARIEGAKAKNRGEVEKLKSQLNRELAEAEVRLEGEEKAELKKGRVQVLVGSRDEGEAKRVWERERKRIVREFERKRAEKEWDVLEGFQEQSRWFVVRKEVEVSWLEAWRKEAATVGGGYEVGEYFQRGLWEAFSGLGVCVEEEKGE